MPLYFGKDGAGGLKYWVESAGVFALKAWSMLSPKTADANADAIIAPKGTGALLGQVPDGTATGGNARGLYAIDLQRIRDNATQVASGDYSGTLAGLYATASGLGSLVVGGSRNIASGWQSTAIGGNTNLASGDQSTAFGRENTASGLRSFAVNRGNTAGAIDSFVAGQGNNVVLGGSYSSITGGLGNLINTVTANASHCHIGGGGGNQLNNVQLSVIAGGSGNIMNQGANVAVIAGGTNNLISGSTSAILGGAYNTITGNYSVICGGGTGTAGKGNTISADRCFIGSGTNNQVSGSGSVVCGGGTGNAGEGNTVSGTNCFVGNGVNNSVSGLFNSLLNGFRATINGGNYVTVLNSFGDATPSANNLTVTSCTGAVISCFQGANMFTTCNTLVALNVWANGAGWVSASRCVGVQVDRCNVTSSYTCSAIAVDGGSISSANYSSINVSTSCGIATDFSTITNGIGFSSRTHHSQATGYVKAQRHIADFTYSGTTTAGETVTAIAIPSSGSLTKDARSVLTIPANSIMVGKLKFSVKEATSLAVTAWIDAQVVIAKGASTPVITINTLSATNGISGVTLAIVNSSTVTDGIEFQITSANAKTLRAKATFEYDLIID